MKPLLILLLLFVFAYLQMGYYFHSLSKRQEAKSEFEQKLKTTLPKDAYTKFDWNSIQHKIRWEEDGKEFWLNGQLYDVVSQQTIDGKRFMLCISDTKEEEVVEQQMKLTVNNTRNTNGKKSSLTQLNFPDIILNELQTCNTPFTITTTKFPNCIACFCTLSLEPNFPPPQIA
jgi:hypothetical protein